MKPAHGDGTQQPDETLPSFVERRERELKHQLAVLRGDIESKERELAQIRQVRAALAPPPPENKTCEVAANLIREAVTQRGAVLMRQADNALVGGVPPLSENRTIKEMIVTALASHFHDGATPAELRTFIKDVFGREIDRTSLSPQLTRLREQGTVEQRNTKWRLSGPSTQSGAANSLQPQKSGRRVKKSSNFKS